MLGGEAVEAGVESLGELRVGVGDQGGSSAVVGEQPDEVLARRSGLAVASGVGMLGRVSMNSNTSAGSVGLRSNTAGAAPPPVRPVVAVAFALAFELVLDGGELRESNSGR